MCLCHFFSEQRERDNLSLCPHIFLFNFIHNECFPYKKQHPLLFILYTANHSCHSSISLSYIVHFLLPRARFLSVCLITAHVKSGTQMKWKLCTHVSDPEVLRDPVAPSPTPLPLSPSAGSAREQRGRGGAAGRPYPGENSQKAALMNIHLWRWLGLWHVILAETRDPRRPWCEAGEWGGGGTIKARGRSHYPALCRLNGIQPGVCVL